MKPLRVSIASVAILSVIALSPARADLALCLRADDPTHITVDGQGRVTSWQNEVGAMQQFTSEAGHQPLFVLNAINGLPAVQFDGVDDVLRSLGFGGSASELTVFLVATPLSNAGGYRGFFSAVDSSTPGHQDYSSGINIDLTGSGSASFDRLNLEGVKGGGGGGINLKTSDDPFGVFKLLAITYGSNQQDRLFVNGSPEGSRVGNANSVSLQDLRIGARYYDNGGGPFETGYLNGNIAEIRVYDTLLSDAQRQAVEQEL